MGPFRIELSIYNRNIAQVTNRFFKFDFKFRALLNQESINACAWDRTTFRRCASVATPQLPKLYRFKCRSINWFYS